METGSIITTLRKEKDWTQTELATKRCVSHDMIGKYERGGSCPI